MFALKVDTLKVNGAFGTTKQIHFTFSQYLSVYLLQFNVYCLCKHKRFCRKEGLTNQAWKASVSC